MRFKITLIPDSTKENLLPINYQYPLASWVYKTIATGDRSYAEWLHANGFADGSKRFKFFCFSNLTTPRARVNGDRLILSAEPVTFLLSFLPERSTEEFVKGVFAQQRATIGDSISRASFSVASIEMVPEPAYPETMEFESLSPVVVSAKRPDGTKEYLSPTDARYAKAIIDNLVRKHQVYYGNDPARLPNEQFELIDEPKLKGVLMQKKDLVRPVKVIGYRFRFRITASPEILRLGYVGGFGEENSMGFGCVGGENLIGLVKDKN